MFVYQLPSRLLQDIVRIALNNNFFTLITKYSQNNKKTISCEVGINKLSTLLTLIKQHKLGKDI